ncbi:Permease of the drug/metabolite transporter (DMT) superfamily [Devosia crocina]|uniref:Permease of the drug/metabolite transporter (DMT) superfamily n=1 Tax=Devosia crocina TaxID=429728 RepID=A0A1I7NDX7_9HYPH|nr:DMT family transporter [Devosia crocina]SFV32841.1 Permease of the drug/metabolite transporter (DMT) superfamily [Devosia crocina]
MNHGNKQLGRQRSGLGTAGGVTAVCIWSLTAPIVASAVGVNPFLYVGLGDGVGALVFLLLWVVRRHNPLPELRRVPLWLYALGVIGIGGHNLTWVAALQQAPPLEATLIIYTWPLLVVVLTTITLGQRFRWFHAVAGVLGLAGIVALLLGKGLSVGTFELMRGHFWAVISAVTWAVFSAMAARYPSSSSNFLGVIFFMSALINGSIWLMIGAPPAPTTSLLIVGISSVVFALAYAMWDFGMKQGNAQLVGVVSFLTPVLTAVYLVALGMAELTPYLFFSLTLVVFGIAIAKYGDRLQLPQKASAYFRNKIAP